MSAPAHEPQLDPCGCCETELPEPGRRNRPGQPALDFRIGTHATFMSRMVARLHARLLTSGTGDGPSLAALTTRASDDPSIALLDTWATVADVLTFYQERIANEGYLRTATERRSVLELARAIGYELNPGVAASTYLAFTVDDSPGSPEVVTVPEGTQVQSVPSSQNERPQTFETVAEMEARSAWNAMRPQQSELVRPSYGSREVYLQGVSTGLEPGDPLLFVGRKRRRKAGSVAWDFRRADAVTVDPEADYTRVTWKGELGQAPAEGLTIDKGRKRVRVIADALEEGKAWGRGGEQFLPPEKWFTVYTFGQRAALFGHNAPDWRTMTDSVKEAFLKPERKVSDYSNWPRFDLDSDDTIHLDSVYSQITPGSWVVLSVPGYEEVYRVVEAEEASRTDFTLTAKTTRLKLEGKSLKKAFGKKRRDVRVFAESERLELAERPIATHLRGKRIVLDRPVKELEKGRTLIVSGKTTMPEKPGETAETVGETAVVVSVSSDRRSVTLRSRLKNDYKRASVTIYGNVVEATHGETVEEVVGSGDGSLPHQRFRLKKPPLTYVSAPTPSGGQSTLEVRVDGVLWQEAASLYGLDDRSRCYTVRIADDGTPSVIFGDGESGARLPSGMENVRATYRSGIGSDGELDAGTLTLQKTRPLGIRAVTNPVAASGAADPETLSNARSNAPLTVLTLDRIVSLRDFEDFARAFSGIGKADAVALWDGETRLVHVTVAASSGKPMTTSSTLYKNLVKAIRTACDPTHTFVVSDYEPIAFNLQAKVRTDPRYVADEVITEVREALKETFAFEQRALGQPVTAAEVIQVMSKVSGVVAVDLDQLYRADDPKGSRQVMPGAILSAVSAEWDAGTHKIRPAQLLMLNGAGVVLLSMEEKP